MKWITYVLSTSSMCSGCLLPWGIDQHLFWNGGTVSMIQFFYHINNSVMKYCQKTGASCWSRWCLLAGLLLVTPVVICWLRWCLLTCSLVVLAGHAGPCLLVVLSDHVAACLLVVLAGCACFLAGTSAVSRDPVGIRSVPVGIC